MAKTTIILTERQTASVEKMCENELNYKIHESYCCNEYVNEIDALLLILKAINPQRYQKYKDDFKEAKKKR